jgi:hypothetical protein
MLKALGLRSSTPKDTFQEGYGKSQARLQIIDDAISCKCMKCEPDNGLSLISGNRTTSHGSRHGRKAFGSK